MPLTAIMAASLDNVIGTTGVDGPCLPWRLPPDLKRFKELTTGHAVIMGHTTFRSIGRALPKRQNIVISRTKRVDTIDPNGTSVWWVTSPAEARDLARTLDPDAFVIGGGQVWSALWEHVDRIELTRVHTKIGLGLVFGFHVPLWRETATSDVMVCDKAERCGVPEALSYHYETWSRVLPDEATKTMYGSPSEGDGSTKGSDK